jgi:hypothetical protein
MGTVMLIGLVALVIEGQLQVIVFLRSKKQSVVSRSTAEAKYRAMSQGLAEMLWVRNLLSELKV